AVPAHPGRRLRHSGDPPPLRAGRLPIPPGQRLLPARPMGRPRRPLRLGSRRTRSGRPGVAPERRVTDALRAEWTKLRTLTSTAWLLIGTVGLTMAVSVAVAAATHVTSGGSQDPTKLSLTGIYLGQTVIAVLAVLT